MIVFEYFYDKMDVFGPEMDDVAAGDDPEMEEVCLSLCLLVCLSVCLSVEPSVCLSAYLLSFLLVCQSSSLTVINLSLPIIIPIPQTVLTSHT